MEHPIGNMMQTTMENIRDMVDVNTVVGDAVVTGGGATIIPISKVCFGFVAGGGEYGKEDRRVRPPQNPDEKWPFAGGSGAGMSVQPVGFLIVSENSVKMLPAQPLSMADRMVELIPQVVEDLKGMFEKDAPKSGGKGCACGGKSGKKTEIKVKLSDDPKDKIDLAELVSGEPEDAQEM